MKKRYVSELNANTAIEDTFVLAAKELRTSRQGKPYLVMRLSDRTGSITGYHFSPSAVEIEIPVASPVVVRGVVGTYRDTKKITVEAMAPSEEAEATKFLARSTRSTDEMLDELRTLVASVHDPVLGKILRGVFSDKVFFDAFCLCPGSQAHHHVFLAGLLEHTVAVATLCRNAAHFYPQVDYNVLVSAAILHDIGQVDALEYDTSIRQSSRGRLLGHSMLSLKRVREAAHRAGVSDNDQALIDLEHAIASHHGEDEGSMQPSTLEALVLFDIDAQDIRTTGFIEATRGAIRAEESWTDSNNLFRRSLQVPRPYTASSPQSPLSHELRPARIA